MLDRLETPEDFAEDGARGVARRDLAKDDWGRQDDQEGSSDPERQTEANDQRRELEAQRESKCPVDLGQNTDTPDAIARRESLALPLSWSS